jgi:hypothetical protein
MCGQVPQPHRHDWVYPPRIPIPYVCDTSFSSTLLSWFAVRVIYHQANVQSWWSSSVRCREKITIILMASGTVLYTTGNSFLKIPTLTLWPVGNYTSKNSRHASGLFFFGITPKRMLYNLEREAGQKAQSGWASAEEQFDCVDIRGIHLYKNSVRKKPLWNH